MQASADRYQPSTRSLRCAAARGDSVLGPPRSGDGRRDGGICLYSRCSRSGSIKGAKSPAPRVSQRAAVLGAGRQLAWHSAQAEGSGPSQTEVLFRKPSPPAAHQAH